MSVKRTSAALRAASTLVIGALSLVASSRTVGATVTEPNGKMVPVMAPQAEVNVATSRGFPADAVTLQGLFKYRNENIGWVSAAQSSPGAFSPTCGFSVQMMIRGGGCQLDFAWYNATEPPTPPPASDLHVLIPRTAYTAAAPNGFGCVPLMPGDFCPLATKQTTNPQNTWTDKIYSSEMIRTDTAYKGGLIGFAIVGAPDDMMGHACTETHYSQKELNTANEVNGMPWVAALMWQSVATPDSFYIGFEDWPMSAANWSSGANDGDFNDFTFFVSGITCKGGGQPCTIPNAIGACAAGKTDCDPSGTGTVCRPQYTAQPETCDNIDNDCNGMVDDGPAGAMPELNCPATRPYCVFGRCVGPCSSGEFRCPGGLTCDATSHCVDMACATVMCPMGQICHAGTCSDACAGVICPTGQTCTLGRCADPCTSVTCPTGKVCELGACVSPCSCRPCGADQVCSTSGKCVETGCQNVTCDATMGQICSKGACIDSCTGAVCPGGATCMAGQCGAPNPDVAGTGGGGVTATTTGVIVTGGGSATATAGSTAGMTVDSSGGVGLRAHSDTPAGCSCRAAGDGAPSSRNGAVAGLLVGLALARRGTRKTTRASRAAQRASS